MAATPTVNLGFLTVLHETNGWLGGYLVTNQWGRPLAEWIALLHALGFAVESSAPMSQGTPFANVLLVAGLDRR